jgi:hypothetical protein
MTDAETITIGLAVVGIGVALGAWLWPRSSKTVHPDLSPIRATPPTSSVTIRPMTLVDASPTPIALPEPSKRVFLTQCPNEVVKPYETHTRAQAGKLFSVYVGKWITIRGTLHDVDQKESMIFVSLTEYLGDPAVHMIFDPRFGPELEHLPKGLALTVIGQVKEASYATLWLDNCEVVDDV